MKQLSSIVLQSICVIMTACAGEESASVIDEPNTNAELPLTSASTSALCTATLPILDVGASEAVTKQFKPEEPNNSAIRRITTISSTTSRSPSAMLTYYDVSGYLPASNRLVYNVHKRENAKDYNYVISTDLKGSDPRTLARWISPTEPTSFGFVSDDGKLLVYMGESTTPGKFDVFRVWLDGSKTLDQKCVSKNISPESYSCTRATIDGKTIPCVERPTLSPPAYDKNLNKYVIAYSFGSNLYAITDDGKVAYPKGASTVGVVNLDAPNTSEAKLGFHRVRINPAFPHLVMYRRAEPPSFQSTPGLFVADLRKPLTHLQVTNMSQGFHPVWRPDGYVIGVNAGEKSGTPFIPRFTEYRVLKDDQTLVGDMSAIVSTSFPNVPKRVFYATYSRDVNDIYVAFATGSDDTSPDGIRAGKIYVAKDDPKEVPRPITYTNFYSETDEEDGQPRMSFYNGSAGIVFSTDNGKVSGGKAAEPQVYTVTGYVTSK
jgi:hypothetical protein